MDKILKILEALAKVPKLMQFSIGIGIAVSIFFWSGGLKIFDTVEHISSYRWEKKISDTVEVVNNFWEDSLRANDVEHWMRMREVRRKHKKEIDSLIREIQ